MKDEHIEEKQRKEMDKEQKNRIRLKIYELLGVTKQGTDAGQEQEYLDQVRDFLLGTDFMRLGRNIQGANWNMALNNGKRLQSRCTELGVTCFDRYLAGIRGASLSQNVNEALQIMSKITEKRVQIRKLLTEEKELCDM